MEKVVVTGLGVISPIGNDIDIFWENLHKGNSGAGKITAFDASDYSVKIAAEVKDFDPVNYMEKKEAKRMDRFAHFAVAAAKDAVKNAGLDISKCDASRIGVHIGSGVGGLGTLEEQHTKLFTKGPRRVSPFFIPMMMGNIGAGQVSINLGTKGPSLSVISACATGTNSIGDAYNLIKSGAVDVMIAGGAEATISPLAVAGFSSMGALSSKYQENPATASRPFDATRDGFLMGEGAGVLVLETLTHAKRRNAKIICEMIGYGSSSDAYHLTSPSPDGEGAMASMNNAILDANISINDIDYINAHGTSTFYNDKFETLAIKKLFGEHAKKLAISSNKSIIGHLLGASGGVEGVSSALTLYHQLIPPTINYETPDEDCDLDYVPNQSRKSSVKYVMSNSFGFGGHNATIILKSFDQ